MARRLRRGQVGGILGPLLFLFIVGFDPFGVPPAANLVLAGTVWIVIWWVTEPVHIAVTSLLPIPLFSVPGVVPVEAVTAQYAHPIVFLLLGGFLLALSVERCGLHRRIAYTIVLRLGHAPRVLLLGLMVGAGFLSMWISNTATTLLLLPIAVAVALAIAGDDDALPVDDSLDSEEVREVPGNPDESALSTFGVGILLGVAYGASIGGSATLIGSTPSAIFAGIARSQLGVQVGFLDWMIFAFPIAIVAILVAWLILVLLTARDVPDGAVLSDQNVEALGPLGTDERRVVSVFGITILAWVLRPFVLEPTVPGLTDPVIAVIGAIGLFLIPGGTDGDDRLLSWDDVRALPWDVLVLIGGSFAIAHAFRTGELDSVVASTLAGLDWLGIIWLVALVVFAAIVISNLMSNTATVTVLLPILVALATVIEAPPVVLMAPVALAASFVFVLPVATPPNAIVYGSGHLELRQMVRVGLVLTLVCVPLIAGLSYLWLTLVNPFG